MIVKQRDKLHEIMKLEALDKRLIHQHPEKEKVRSEWKIKQTELSGEKEVDYPLGFLDDKKYFILHNVRLADSNGYFQIDTFVLSDRFLLIIDAKNWRGRVSFGQNGQVTRYSPDGKVEGFKNPVSQVKTQAFRLQRWLLSKNIPEVPIAYLVDFSFPKTIIEPASPDIKIPAEVIHNSDLLFRIQELEKKYTKRVMTMSQLHKVGELLKSAHVLPRDILSNYHYSSSDIIKGVYCPECGLVPMEKGKRKWFCSKCRCYSEMAFISALNDYMLLFGDRITNKQAREFLKLPSRHVVNRLMHKGGYLQIGRNKGSVYQIILK
ncbi:nuclease-related domain-containing protein [Oceanobacillus senegalensis]|uniref:nuclease-related domain-containing protein n=1 Tax=Oceanobacillus senegalensis TaxID=1936063 RepID=UPI00117F8425|nr:nuclease-related domain-containing protein [Oceanobacillus senegalensis]